MVRVSELVSFRRRSRALVALSIVGLTIAVANGCGKEASVRKYSVPKPPHRMLGAMALNGGQAWFFKVSGEREKVDRELSKFEGFLKSVKFGEGKAAAPEWTLPEGWKQLPGNEQRHATIKLGGGDDALELSVTKLPAPPGDPEGYKLSNINRWRQQLRLGPLMKDELEGASQVLKSDAGQEITLVNYVGTMAAPRRDGGPMMGMAGMGGMGGGMGGMGANPHGDLAGGPGGAGFPSAGAGPGAGEPEELPFDFQAPKEWKSLPPTAFRRLSFRAGESDAPVEITVSNLLASANDVLANINRWRGQVGLPEISAADLKANSKAIDVGGVGGTFVELVGTGDEETRKAILGTIVVRDDQMWFFKLTGPAKAATAEQAAFEQFVKSIKFK